MERKQQDNQLQEKVRDVNRLLEIKTFAEFDKKVPAMRKAAKMSKSQLYIRLTEIPSSIFYKNGPRELSDVLTHGVAVQYLARLIMMNERDRSDLSLVDELR